MTTKPIKTKPNGTSTVHLEQATDVATMANDLDRALAWTRFERDASEFKAKIGKAHAILVKLALGLDQLATDVGAIETSTDIPEGSFQRFDSLMDSAEALGIETTTKPKTRSVRRKVAAKSASKRGKAKDQEPEVTAQKRAEFIEHVAKHARARRKNASPAMPDRCADCGAEGERTGHMTCQYPKNHR